MNSLLKSKVLSVIMIMCLVLIGMGLTASESHAAVNTIYVSASGDDSTGSGAQASPYKTLNKAVAESQNSGDTICLLSDLTDIDVVRIPHDMTITSDSGHNYMITRSSSFNASQDTGRSSYNPAMIEASSNTTLTLQNITLSDNGSVQGTKYAQAVSGGGDTSHNLDYVQDAMVAAYSDTSVIVLGAGSELKDYAGMSAVRVNGGAKVTMKDGSVIDDTSATAHNGLAAIWSQGGTVSMEKGSSITKIQGTAIKAEITSNVTINGSITKCTVASGTAVSLSATTCEVGQDGTLDSNNSANGAVYAFNGSSVVLKGKVTNNTCSGRGGGLYIVDNGNPASLTIEDGALISGNHSTDTGGGVMLNNNCTCTMNGGTISGNTSDTSGGGIEVRKGALFTMNGGSILNNTATQYGGGVNLEALSGYTNYASITLKQGTITGNTAGQNGNDAGVSPLNANGGYIRVFAGFKLGDNTITLPKYSAGLIPTADNQYLQINTNASSVESTLEASATSSAFTGYTAGGSGISNLIAAWISQTPENTTHVKIDVSKMTSASKPGTVKTFYIEALPLKDDGTVDSTAKAVFYKADSASNGIIDVKVSTTGGKNYALALVQSLEEAQQIISAKRDQTITASSVTKAYGSGTFSLGAATTGDSKLTYSSSNSKVVSVSDTGVVTMNGYGTANVIINAPATSSYEAASKTVTVTVVPAKAKMKSISFKKFKKKYRNLTAKWIKDATVTGYQVYVSKTADFKKLAANTVATKNTTVSNVFKKLKKNQCYFVKVREYATVDGTSYYGEWSNPELNVAQASLKSIKSGHSKQLAIKWTKDKAAKGYQVYVSKYSNFKKMAYKGYVNGSKHITKTVKKLKKGSTYYVMVREYRIANGAKYFGKWSAVASAKVK